ncbi:histidine kinase [Chitinophagaceae bacterium MMS25-I14]
MRPYFTCLLCSILLVYFSVAHAQTYNRHHLDLYNGLPSNLLYGIVKDNHGYLWLCTDKGLARYNGYTVKTYTTEDGLPSNDVWGLHADKKGRLWLYVISGRIGYLNDGKYKDVYVPPGNGTFYIKNIKNHGDGVWLFSSAALVEGAIQKTLYTVQNDTVKPVGLYDGMDDVVSENNIITFLSGKISLFNVDKNGSSHILYSCPRMKDSTMSYSVVHNNYCYRYLAFTNELDMLNLATCTDKKIFLKDAGGSPDPIYMLITDADKTFIITRKNIFSIDTGLNIKYQYPVYTLVSDTEKTNGFRLCGFLQDTLWGKCVATQTTGLYINYDQQQHLDRILSADLGDYSWIGNAANDTASYWWSYKARTLLTINEQGHTNYQHHKLLYDVIKMAHYSEDSSILIEKVCPTYYIHRSQTTVPLLKWYQYIYPNGGKSVWVTAPGIYTRDLAVAAPGHFYIAGRGFFDCTVRNDSMTSVILDNTWYYHLLQDTMRKAYWAYYNDRLLLYKPADRSKLVLGPILKTLGISDVEQLEMHPATGNIFVKDHTGLLLIDPLRGTMTNLFKNYNLKEAKFFLKNDRLILAGKFGVLISYIKNGNTCSAPMVFPNIKNNRYFQVTDMAVMQHTLLLKTDKCTYIADIPDDTAFGHISPETMKHKVIVQYRDTLYDIPGTRTLNITGTSDKLLFDVISPEGNGLLHFRDRMGDSGTWHSLNGNELKLPPMIPGRYYTLFISASDDAWISDEIPVTLYIVPEWWQTPGWTIAIQTGILVAFLSLILMVILITRHFVNRAANRKQLLSSLEYRVIHSQINPHFIFNTLNTALYFIKKEKTAEAVTHVSRFSRLLRGYLEASEKRYISIADEITILKSYIELQQTRFEHMFTYSITTVEDLTTESLYIPSMLLQPLVENAINHGLIPKGPGGWLNISFSKNGMHPGIVCIIDDNGIGRKQAAENKRTQSEKRISHGNRLTEELVDLFNRYEKMGIEIVYTDKEGPHTGTCVTIIIKQPRNEPK